jgi:integrase
MGKKKYPGTTKRKSDGLWQASYYVDGKRHFEYGKTDKEAYEEARKAEKDGRKPTKESFADAVNCWLEDMKPPRSDLRITTWMSYEYICRIHIIPSALGKKKYTAITPEDVRKFYGDKRIEPRLSRRIPGKKYKKPEVLKPLSQNSIKHIHNIINQVFQQLLSDTKIAKNPIDAIEKSKRPKIDRKEAKFLTSEQIDKLFSAIKDDPWYSAYFITAHVGCRLGEIVGLKWENVDTKRGTIKIVEAVSREKHDDEWKTESHTPKSKAGNRVIKLDVPALAEFKKMQRGIGYIFRWPDGRRVEPLYLSRHFTKLAKRNGFDITFHGLRHSFGSTLMANGVHPKIVSKLMGHSSITITLDTYSHIAPGLEESTIDKLKDIYATTTN